MVPSGTRVDGQDPRRETVASEERPLLVYIIHVSNTSRGRWTILTSNRDLELDDGLQESSHALRRVEDLHQDLREMVVVADGTHFAESECECQIGLT